MQRNAKLGNAFKAIQVNELRRAYTYTYAL
jgi:hypothetical protein